MRALLMLSRLSVRNWATATSVPARLAESTVINVADARLLLSTVTSGGATRNARASYSTSNDAEWLSVRPTGVRVEAGASPPALFAARAASAARYASRDAMLRC